MKHKRSYDTVHSSRPKLRRILLSLSLLVILACGWMAPPVQDEMAQGMLNQLTLKNRDVGQFKGFMQIRLHWSQGDTSGRAAVAAVFPDRLRIEWLSFLGQPLMRFVADGETLWVHLPGEDKHLRIKQDRDALDRLIRIPMGIDDFLNIIKGCPALPEYTAAQIQKVEGQFTTIAMVDRWHTLRSLLRFSTDGLIQEMANFGQDGALSYRVVWNGWQRQQGVELPKDIEIVAGTGERVLLTMDRIYPGAPVAPELFSLDAESSQ